MSGTTLARSVASTCATKTPLAAAATGQTASADSISAYETKLRAAYQSHWSTPHHKEWAVNFLLLMKLAAACKDEATRDQLMLRAFAYAYIFSYQNGMADAFNWQCSPLNDITAYHRNRIGTPNLKSDEVLKEVGQFASCDSSQSSSINAIRLSSMNGVDVVIRQMLHREKILGAAKSTARSLKTPGQEQLDEAVLLTGVHPQDEELHMAIMHSGYALRPHEAIEDVIANCTPIEALRKLCANLHVRSFVEKGLEDQADTKPLVPDSNAPSWKAIGSSAAAHRLESGMRSSSLDPCIEKVGAVMLSNIRGLEQLGTRLDRLATDPAQVVFLSHMRARIQKNLDKASTHMDSMYSYLNDMRLINEDIATILTVMQPYEKRELDLHMPSAGKVQPSYSMRNSGLNAFSSIVTAGKKMSTDGSMPRVMTQANSYYESVFALRDSTEFMKLHAMNGEKLKDSLDGLKKTLNGQKLDVFVGQFHDNISMNLHAYHAQNLQEQVDALLKSGLVSDRLTIGVDTTIGRQDAPELKSLVASLAPLIENGKVNLVIFRSGLKFDLAGMDNSSGALITTYNNGDKHWKQFNESTYSPHAMRGPDFQVHTHMQKHSAGGLNDYRSAIAKHHRDMMKRLPESMITSPTTGRSNSAIQILSNDDPDMVFMDLRPSSELLKAGGHATDIARAIGLAVGVLTPKKLRERPSFGYGHSSWAPIDETRVRITLGLEDRSFMDTVAMILVAANKVAEEAVKSGDPKKTADLFNDQNAIVEKFHELNPLIQRF